MSSGQPTTRKDESKMRSFMDFGGGELRLDRPDEFPKGVDAVAAILDDHGLVHVNFAAAAQRFQILALDARMIHGRMIGHPPPGIGLEPLRLGIAPDAEHDEFTLWAVHSAHSASDWLARGGFHDVAYVAEKLYPSNAVCATALAVLINRIELARLGQSANEAWPGIGSIEQIEDGFYERLGRRLDEAGSL